MFDGGGSEEEDESNPGVGPSAVPPAASPSLVGLGRRSSYRKGLVETGERRRHKTRGAEKALVKLESLEESRWVSFLLVSPCRGLLKA